MNSPAPDAQPQPQAKPSRRVTKILVRYIGKGVMAGGLTVNPEMVSALQAEVVVQRSRMGSQLIAGLVLIAIGVIAPALIPLWGLAVGAAAALLGAFMLVLRSQSAGVMAQAALAAKLANEASGEIFQSASNAMFDL